jgi:MFS family permease
MNALSASQKREIRRTEFIYYAVQVLFWLSISLPAALAVLLIQARGLNLFQIGLALGAFSLTVVLLEVPSGVWADVVGRKRISLLAYAFLLAESLVFLFAFSFPVLLASSVLNGIGRAFASGALQAWFIDRLQAVAPKIDIQPPLAKAGTVELLSLTAGTLLGGYLPTLFGFLPKDGATVFTPLAMSVVSSVVVKGVLIAFVSLFVKEGRGTQGSEDKAKGMSALAAVVRSAFGATRESPVLLLLLGATLVSGFAMAGIETFWQPRFSILLGGTDDTFVFGVIMAGSFLVGALGNALSIPLSRLFRKRYGLVAAVFQGLQGVSLVLLALQTATLPAAALFWLVYLNMAVKSSPSMTLLNQEVSAVQRAAMLSVASLAAYAGYFSGSIVLGYVAERVGIPLAWLVAGGATLLSLFFYLKVDAKVHKDQAARRGANAH